MTGIETVFCISFIIFGSDILATPPNFLISEGTLSNAITAQAPASSAIFACSGFVTSIITPPFNISAKFLFKLYLSFILIPPSKLFRFYENNISTIYYN